MSANLVPCPLCGAQDGYSIGDIDYPSLHPIDCKSCHRPLEFFAYQKIPGVEIPAGLPDADAAWNAAGKHAQGLRDEIARLRAAIEYTLPVAEEEWVSEHFTRRGVRTVGIEAIKLMRAALAKEPK